MPSKESLHISNKPAKQLEPLDYPPIPLDDRKTNYQSTATVQKIITEVLAANPGGS